MMNILFNDLMEHSLIRKENHSSKTMLEFVDYFQKE